jgi:hypothetical protein
MSPEGYSKRRLSDGGPEVRPSGRLHHPANSTVTHTAA